MLALATEPDNAAGGALRACPQCDRRQGVLLATYSQPPWRVVRCGDCGFVYLENPPPTELLDNEFSWDKTSDAESARRKSERPARHWLDRKTRWRRSLFSTEDSDLFPKLFPAGNVLDVGCGRGSAVPEPYIPFGIEISAVRARQAAATMEPRGGRVVHAPAVEGIAQFPDHYFTGVVLRSYLEHETRPKEVLREVARVMADNGAAFVKLPNYGSINRHIMGGKWCGFRHPDHVNYFTLGTLRKMAMDCGLRLKLIQPLLLPFNDNIKAVLTKV